MKHGPNLGEIYTCAACGGRFMATRSYDEAKAESLTLWGDIPIEEMAVICDDCFNRGKDAALLAHHAKQRRN